MLKKGECILNEVVAFPFGNSVLLRHVRTRDTMNNSMSLEVRVKSLKFAAPI